MLVQLPLCVRCTCQDVLLSIGGVRAPDRSTLPNRVCSLCVCMHGCYALGRHGPDCKGAPCLLATVRVPARMRCVWHRLDAGSAVTGPKGKAYRLWHAPDLVVCRLQNLRAELFARILRQPIEFFDDAEVGVLTSRLGNDCQARRGLRSSQSGCLSCCYAELCRGFLCVTAASSSLVCKTCCGMGSLGASTRRGKPVHMTTVIVISRVCHRLS